MQHATLSNIATDVSSVPVLVEKLEGDHELGLHIKKMDKTISIIQRQPTEPSSLPPTEIAHGLSEPKISDSNNKLVTKSATTKMPHSPASCGDAIDCGMVVQNENCHELTPALKGSPIVDENNSQLTPSQMDIPYRKNGHHFLGLLKTEQTRLLAMAEQVERDMYTLSTNRNHEVSEEILGILRSVSGKTKLLVSQKLKQFEGLCYSNMNPKDNEKFPTTTEDLQGFWDMVNLQIEHIDSLFKEIDVMKSNNWQSTKDNTHPFVPTGTKLMKRPVQKNGNSVTTTTKASPNATLMAQKREAQRKQLLELKRKNKNAATDRGALTSPIEIYVHENFV